MGPSNGQHPLGEPRVEIRPESPRVHVQPEIPVRRGDDPDVQGVGVAPADPADLLALQEAQEARLDVQVGDEVAAGEQIGTVGSTGRSTGPHLHLEIRTDAGAVDPEAWLRGE